MRARLTGLGSRGRGLVKIVSRGRGLVQIVSRRRGLVKIALSLDLYLIYATATPSYPT